MREFLYAVSVLERTPTGEIVLGVIYVAGLFALTFAGLGLGEGM